MEEFSASRDSHMDLTLNRHASSMWKSQVMSTTSKQLRPDAASTLRLISILLLHTNNLIRRLKRIKRLPLLSPIAHTRIVLRPLLASLAPPQTAVLAIVDDTRLAVGVGETAAGPAAFFDLAAAGAHVLEGLTVVALGDAADVPDFEGVVPSGVDGGDAGGEGEEGGEEGGDVHFWWWGFGVGVVCWVEDDLL